MYSLQCQVFAGSKIFFCLQKHLSATQDLYSGKNTFLMHQLKTNFDENLPTLLPAAKMIIFNDETVLEEHITST